jgi:hypothetical protein
VLVCEVRCFRCFGLGIGAAGIRTDGTGCLMFGDWDISGIDEHSFVHSDKEIVFPVATYKTKKWITH